MLNEPSGPGKQEYIGAMLLDVACTVGIWTLNVASWLGTYAITVHVLDSSPLQGNGDAQFLVGGTVAFTVWASMGASIMFIFKWIVVGDISQLVSGQPQPDSGEESRILYFLSRVRRTERYP